MEAEQRERWWLETAAVQVADAVTESVVESVPDPVVERVSYSVTESFAKPVAGWNSQPGGEQLQGAAIFR